MSNHSFAIFSVSVCETEASYSLLEFIFSSLYLIPLLTVSVNLLLHKPFPYSGIFNIILILSSSTLKKKKKKIKGKKKRFFQTCCFPKMMSCFFSSFPSMSSQNLGSSSLYFFIPVIFFFFFFLTSQPWHCYLAPFWNFYFSCHYCFLVLIFDYFSLLNIHFPSAN